MPKPVPGAREASVRAIVLTGSVPDDLSYAAAAVSGTVSFKTYRVAVAFEDVMV